MLFSEELVNQIWAKGQEVHGADPAKFRKDACGAWIARDKFGSSDSCFGWVIDHIYPQSKGGGNAIENLRPLHVENQRSKGDSYPAYIACMTSQGEKNIRKLRTIVVNIKKQVQLRELFGAKDDSKH